MFDDLDGKVAVVTGGARGLGLEMADALAEMGCAVALFDVGNGVGSSAAQLAERRHVRTMGLSADVTDDAALAAAFTRVQDELGTPAVLVNAAGVAAWSDAEEMPAADWRRVVDVNLTGTFLFSQAAGRAMIDQGGGKIVNIASVTGLVGSPPEILDSVPYSATKGAILALTRDLAVKWARHGITVNAIAPGWFPTELTNAVLDRSGDQLRESIPLRRFGSPDDLKGAIVFLASAASDYVTGQTLVVDGGHSAW